MDRQARLDGLSLIDVSAEDDSLISTATNGIGADRTLDFSSSPATKMEPYRPDTPSTSQHLVSSELVEGSGVNEKHSTLNEDNANCHEGKQNNLASLGMDKEQLPISEEPAQPKRRKRAGQCNLRKSLAWDKAFFTNEGVLNPVELSLVNRTFKKSNESLLPSIEEEEPIRSSLDSNCSLSSDGLTLQYLEEKLFTEPQISIPKLEDKVDNTNNTALSELVSTKHQGPRQSKTKPLVLEKRHISKKAAKSTSQIRPRSGLPISSIVKRPSAKGMEELQKAEQSKDPCAKSCLPAPTVPTKNVYSGHKRAKYTHENTLPANWPRMSGHRSSPENVNDVVGIRSRCALSPTSTEAVSAGAAKHSALSSHISAEKREKPLSEMPMEIASEAACLNNDKICPSTSSVRSLDGKPAMMFDNSKSKADRLDSHDQFTSSTGVAISTESVISQCTRKNQGLGNSKQVLPPTKDASNTACNIAGNVPSVSGSFVPGLYRSRPSSLRMPSPKLGFFDPAKVIRSQNPSALHKRSTGNHAVPPKSMTRGTGKLKPCGVPCVRPIPTVVTSSSFPSYAGGITSNIPRPNTILKSSIPSIPASSSQSQLKSKPVASDAVLLAQQKSYVSSKPQPSLADQFSNQKQVSLNACQAEAAVIAEGLQGEPLQDDQCTQEDGNSSVARECCAELEISEGKFTSGHLPNALCSEAIHENINSTETSPVAEVIDLPADYEGRINSTETSPVAEVIDLPADYEGRMGLLADVTTGDPVSQAVRSEQLPSPREGELENVTEGHVLEESQARLDNLEGKFISQNIPEVQYSEGIKANTTSTETLLEPETGDLSGMNGVIKIQPRHRETALLTNLVGDACQGRLDFSRGKSALQDMSNVMCPEANHANTNLTELSAVSETHNASDMNGVINLQPNNEQGTTLFGNVTIGNSTSEFVKSEHWPSPDQGKLENATERDIPKEVHISPSIGCETCSYLVKNEEWAGACRHVPQESIRKQNAYSDDEVKNDIAGEACGLQMKNVIECNFKEDVFPLDGSVNSNTKKEIATDIFNSSSQWSDSLVYEDSSKFLGQNSNSTVDSSPVCMKLSHDSVLVGVQVESNPNDAVQETKPTGRSPLTVNSGLLNASDQGFAQKKGKNGSIFATRRFSSSSVACVSGMSGQENIMLEGQHAGGLSHKDNRRKSLDCLRDEVKDNKNPFDASPFSEEWIRAVEAAGEEWLQMKGGRVQNSPPDKVAPQPGPWSPVRRNGQQLGPFDCTKYTNALGSSGMHQDQ